MPHVVNGACRIYYRTDGTPEAPPILFSNSLGTTHELWNPQVGALSSSFRIIRYDTRGHGLSEAPPGEYTIGQLGSDALAVLDAVGVDRANICGLSLGGLTAMWLGIHFAERVNCLTLASTGARIASTALWQERIQQVNAGGLQSIAKGATERWFTAPFRAANPRAVEHHIRMLTEGTPGGYIGCCAALRDTDLREEIAAIVAPTLVIGAIEDPLTPPANAEFINARISESTLAIVPGSHIANVEQAAAFNEQLLRFLNG